MQRLNFAIAQRLVAQPADLNVVKIRKPALIQAGLMSSWKTLALSREPLITSVKNYCKEKSKLNPFSTFCL